jgi:hypothetical protein
MAGDRVRLEHSFQNYSVVMSQFGRFQTFSVTSPCKLHLSLRGEGNAFVSSFEPILALAVSLSSFSSPGIAAHREPKDFEVTYD